MAEAFAASTNFNGDDKRCVEQESASAYLSSNIHQEFMEIKVDLWVRTKVEVDKSIDIPMGKIQGKIKTKVFDIIKASLWERP